MSTFVCGTLLVLAPAGSPGAAGAPAAAPAAVPPSPPARPRSGDRFFAEGAFHQVRIEMPPSGVESLRTKPREDVRAALRIGQDEYPQVTLHLKGSSGSYRSVDDKPALTLNFPQDRPCDGLRKIHLNNSVEDPSYLNEWLGSDLFRVAGVPAPRVAHARVELNGRALGLYVLKEGFTEEFLGGHFEHVDGNLYEPESGHDVDLGLKRQLGRGATSDSADLEPLATALADTDGTRRWQRIDAALDTDRFLSFMALEVMMGHRDGYCLARNNFRIYHDPGPDKMVFLPHGMDQLLGTPDLPWRPHMAGLVARAVLDTAEGRQRYRERFTELLGRLFVTDVLTRRVDEHLNGLRPFLRSREFKQLELEATSLKQRIARRAASLRRQLAEAEPSVLEFIGRRSLLQGWRAVDASSAREMDRMQDSEGRSILRIAAGQTTSASWRLGAMLPRGKYRFEGRVRVIGVRPLRFGKAHGAYLRVSGGRRAEKGLTGDTPWQQVTMSFDVESAVETVDLVCELRARAGEAWFDADSLSVVRTSL